MAVSVRGVRFCAALAAACSGVAVFALFTRYRSISLRSARTGEAITIDRLHWPLAVEVGVLVAAAGLVLLAATLIAVKHRTVRVRTPVVVVAIFAGGLLFLFPPSEVEGRRSLMEPGSGPVTSASVGFRFVGHRWFLYDPEPGTLISDGRYGAHFYRIVYIPQVSTALLAFEVLLVVSLAALVGPRRRV